MTAATAPTATEATINLDAITANARELHDIAGVAELMAIVKADGYGHGALPVARAALAGGAAHIGVATPVEAVALRQAGLTAPLLAWLWPPTENLESAVAAGVQVAIASRGQLDAVLAAAPHSPGMIIEDYGDLPAGCAPIHLKVDTGMSRNGVPPRELPELIDAIVAAEKTDQACLVGVMTHLASADDFDSPATSAQAAVFADVTAQIFAAGLQPRWQHLSNTAATLTRPELRRDMVRCGIGLYGYSPVPTSVTLTPAMTLRATVTLTKRVSAGQGVGYGLDYHTSQETTLALIPLGYGDGIPRHAGNRAEVAIRGRRYRIAGRVAMDQIVIDCGNDPVVAGDEVIVFGPGTQGEPTATDWANWCETIDYEIITRISPRVPRRYIGAAAAHEPPLL